jgi:hypothetical protein
MQQDLIDSALLQVTSFQGASTSDWVSGACQAPAALIDSQFSVRVVARV